MTSHRHRARRPGQVSPVGIAVAAALAMSLSAACGGGSGGSGFKAEDSADNLRAFFTELQAAIKKGDNARAAALTRDVIPTKESLAKALKDDAPAQLTEGVLAQVAKLPKEDAKVARLFSTNPERTEIQVHGATTEEIAAAAPGTPAGDEFPGGAVELAKTALRPGVKFYEVELLEPGKDAGMKYHMFFFDGKRWAMLGAAWRGLR